jgi:predicted RNase H-like HicB family nuclease
MLFDPRSLREEIKTKTYLLYLESGPKKRKTMVHVLELLGCIAQGATTAEALQVTPAAICEFLRFLSRHGDPVDPSEDFATEVAEHVMEGGWLGNGDPASGFEPDFQPLTIVGLQDYVRHLAWIHAALAASVAGLPLERLTAQPEGNARTLYAILEHSATSECTYLRMAVGKVPGMAEALKPVQTGPEDLAAHLAGLWQILESRFASLSEIERTQPVPHGQVTWTAYRGLRRALEHNWEHLLEISARLGVDAVQS